MNAQSGWFWIVFAAVVGAVLLSALAMAIHTWEPRGDRPRMTVREFFRGIRF